VQLRYRTVFYKRYFLTFITKYERKLFTAVCLLGDRKVSAGASSRDKQATPGIASTQQGDAVESFRQKYLSSGQF